MAISSYKGHMRDALAARGDEGRRSLRKAPVSGQARDDPEMSEWGNPAHMCVTLKREPTQGTETSKYLQERKSNETPSVAASERGRAQTVPGSWSGVVGRTYGTVKARGSLWNEATERVKSPYSKAEAGQYCS